MTDRSVTHATFVIEHAYDASPRHVFAAFADPAIKRRWFGDPNSPVPSTHELDFRLGGTETNRGGPPDGPVYTFEALYQDIVPDQRIVTTYAMAMDQTRISVSVATVEFRPAGHGTLLVYTEQGAFLDGHDTPAQREHGTRELLEALGAELGRHAAAPERSR